MTSLDTDLNTKQQGLRANNAQYSDQYITVSLLYADAPVDISTQGKLQKTRQHYKTLTIKKGTSLYNALVLADWLELFSDIKDWCDDVMAMTDGVDTAPIARNWRVGVYSQKQPLSYILKNTDRIEVYRPLSANPMKRRKLKARK